jgi:hypothetical protein
MPRGLTNHRAFASISVNVVAALIQINEKAAATSQCSHRRFGARGNRRTGVIEEVRYVSRHPNADRCD